MKKTLILLGLMTAFIFAAFEPYALAQVTGSINDHSYVDLGLSVKWATCNVGADSPETYGDYFAWGEITPKALYTEKNCVAYGKTIEEITGDTQYDVARSNWGGTWRMPTDDEMGELISLCKFYCTVQGGHQVLRVTGPNGKFIFLPLAGYKNGTSIVDERESGYYWSSTPAWGCTVHASALYIENLLLNGDCLVETIWEYRDYGMLVRPVSD